MWPEFPLKSGSYLPRRFATWQISSTAAVHFHFGEQFLSFCLFTLTKVFYFLGNRAYQVKFLRENTLLDEFSRFWGVHISRKFNFAILRKCCVLSHSNFSFLRETIFSLVMWINMSLNKAKRLYRRYNNVKINKKTTAGLYVKSNKNWSSSHNVYKQFLLVRELLFLSQLTRISIYIENSFLRTPKKKWYRSVT